LPAARLSPGLALEERAFFTRRIEILGTYPAKLFT